MVYRENMNALRIWRLSITLGTKLPRICHVSSLNGWSLFLKCGKSLSVPAKFDQTAWVSRRFVKDVHVTFVIYSSALCPLIGN